MGLVDQVYSSPSTKFGSYSTTDATPNTQNLNNNNYFQAKEGPHE